MKYKVLFFLIFLPLYGEYTRSSCYKGSALTEITDEKDFFIEHTIDMRYINNREKKRKGIDRADYKPLLDQEESLKIKSSYRMYSYIFNEREVLYTSDSPWSIKDIRQLYSRIKEAVLMNNFTSDDFPPSVAWGTGYNPCSRNISKEECALAVNTLLKEKQGFTLKISVSSEGYVVSVTDKYRQELVSFYLYYVKNSLFSDLNNSYEISAVHRGQDYSNLFLLSEGITVEKKLIYGFEDLFNPFEAGDDIVILTPQILADKESSKDFAFQKGEVLRVLKTGPYDTGYNTGGQWLYVQDKSSKKLWIFSGTGVASVPGNW